MGNSTCPDGRWAAFMLGLLICCTIGYLMSRQERVWETGKKRRFEKSRGNEIRSEMNLSEKTMEGTGIYRNKGVEINEHKSPSQKSI